MYLQFLVKVLEFDAAEPVFPTEIGIFVPLACSCTDLP